MSDSNHPSPNRRARLREVRLAAVARQPVRSHCVFVAVCTVFCLTLLAAAIPPMLLLAWGAVIALLTAAAYSVGDYPDPSVDAGGALGRRDWIAGCQSATALAWGLIGWHVCGAGSLADGAVLVGLSIALGVSHLPVGAASRHHSFTFLLLSLGPPSYQCLVRPELDMQRLGSVLAVALAALLIAGWSCHRSLVRRTELENDNREMAQTLRCLHEQIRDDAT